ncbi:alpha/beta fold hydrolase [Paenisporosarcina antarctica]|uniref:Alpha/beta fold hydrolase n=1 Tax=Paenisporosarcina antarctica TaxID=417367 RepID=A0A4P7A2H3_9BACL|nr:alpha/beta fold hydrolase [Paenisporosarcina antarctica]QBP42136.1 alpha/beta fold hydrolase [Paenisporosarcina antarctica]
MNVFESNGVSLVYEEFGEGEPLLLLHGLTGNRHMFDEDVNVFRKYFRTIVLDARGHGDSDKPVAYTLDDHIADVLRLLDHLEIDASYLIGVSMGSYIAQGVAIASPERVKQMILVATKPEGKTSSLQALFLKYQNQLEGLSFSQKVMKVSPYMFHDLGAIGEWSKEAAKKSSPLQADQIVAANAALEGFDFRHDLHLVTAKTLVISGNHDELNPPEVGRETARLIPHATFVEFNQSGHAPNVEQHLLYMDFVLEFLNKK